MKIGIVGNGFVGKATKLLKSDSIDIIVYDIKIFQLLKQNVWNKKEILSAIKTQNKLIKKWTILLFFALIIISLRFFILYYKQFLFFEPVLFHRFDIVICLCPCSMSSVLVFFVFVPCPCFCV
jgi:hypothetical protein